MCKANMDNADKLIDHIIEISKEHDYERYAMVEEINRLCVICGEKPKWLRYPPIGDSEIVFELKNLKKLIDKAKKVK